MLNFKLTQGNFVLFQGHIGADPQLAPGFYNIVIEAGIIAGLDNGFHRPLDFLDGFLLRSDQH